MKTNCSANSDDSVDGAADIAAQNTEKLRELEMQLIAEGHKELATQVHLLHQDRLPFAEITKLEKALAQQANHHGASLVYERRVLVDEKRAILILAGSASTPDEMLAVAGRLRSAKRFGLARRILKVARTRVIKSEYPTIYLKIFQQSALCTYKDPDLPLEWRLDEGLRILERVEDLNTTTDQETLGLAGAIHKRKWEVDGRRLHLERSLLYYLRGYAQSAPPQAHQHVIQYLRNKPGCRLNAEKDQGYNGINAAFILDLLAEQEEAEAKRVGLVSDAAPLRREGARLIREEILRSVPPLLATPEMTWLADKWWFYATVGEAYFGLGSYDAANYQLALDWLVTRPAAVGLISPFDLRGGLQIPEWEYESTARQLARLARLHCDPKISEDAFAQTTAGLALKEFLQGNDKAVRSAFHGKFGLGLSGGGFRASLFHIGVLAQLAELDVLRHVEVLSCVSGGSIVGAHYYLELRHLLETRTDDEITREDYIAIVERTEKAFLKGVQRNIRMRVLAEWTTNLRMIFQPGYSRTMRIGELYERELYSKIADITGEDKNGKPTFRRPVIGQGWVPDWLAQMLRLPRESRWLNKLFICPKQANGSSQKDFNPRNHNWRRNNKVPVLILNAATLNTGHNWQFTASFMGEPPAPINVDIDTNHRLRRMYYKDAPPEYRNMRLGYAVAASSCVPGLFEPLILDGLFPNRSVRLVDGGVCDNQGVASLIEQDCTVLLVSDASGQMETQNVPSKGVVGVPLRSNGILQARVREAQYGDIRSRRRSSLLRGLMFIHLKQGLRGNQEAWVGCPAHLEESDFESAQTRPSDMTKYNISVETERRLAAIRTDLDSFNDVEAFALMTSGYRMTAQQFTGDEPCVEGFSPPRQTHDWRFLKLESAMQPDPLNPRAKGSQEWLHKFLDVAASPAFKVWKLWPPLIFLKWIMIVFTCGAVVWLFYGRWDSTILPSALHARFTYETVGAAVITFIAFSLFTAVLKLLLGRKSGKRVMFFVRWRETLKNIVIGLGMATVGFIVARLHLHVFDKLYLRLGRLDR